MTTAPTIRSTEAHEEFTVALELLGGYAFRVDFVDDEIEPLHTDETPPLGDGNGPSPSRMLAAAIVNCLSASLVHCLRRARVEIAELTATARVTIGRNDRGRLRVQRIAVQLAPQIAAEHAAQLARCTEVFQQYCTVTASIREGFEITADVTPTASLRG